MWFRRKRKQKVVRSARVTKHYQEHKEAARVLIHGRLEYFNQHYKFSWKRVAIRNQRRCWGSCSSLNNLNFNYKLLFLPPHLQDYIVVHEMCHLAELNHGQQFWDLVAQAIPRYQQCVRELRVIDKGGGSIVHLLKVQAAYAAAGSAATPSDQEKLAVGAGVSGHYPEYSIVDCLPGEACDEIFSTKASIKGISNL